MLGLGICGRGIIASFAVFGLWFTTRTFHMKVLPNSTGVVGPENEMARPLPQRTDVLGVPVSDTGAVLEPAGVTGRLCGRFARWRLCLGGP